MTPEAAWQSAINQLELHIRSSFDISYKHVTFDRYDAGVYHILVPAEGIKNQCIRFQRNLVRILTDITGESVDVSFSIIGEHNGTAPADAIEQQPESAAEEQPEEDTQPERQPDEWHYFARVPEHIIDTLDAGPGWLMTKFIRHINRKTNLMIKSYEDLEPLFGISASTIKRHSKVLEAAGYLHIKHGKGRKVANEYRLIGPLAIAVCGLHIANETALQIKLEQRIQPQTTPPNQPESTENEADKTGQIDLIKEEHDQPDEEKQVKLTSQVSKTDQIDPTSQPLIGQIDPPIQSNKSFPDVNDIDVKTNKSIHLIQGNDLEETKLPSPPAPQYPALAAWVKEWGEVTTTQRMRLMEISQQYDPAGIQSAMKAAVQAYTDKIVRYDTRLDYFETACKQRSGNTLAALAVAAS